MASLPLRRRLFDDDERLFCEYEQQLQEMGAGVAAASGSEGPAAVSPMRFSLDLDVCGDDRDTCCKDGTTVGRTLLTLWERLLHSYQDPGFMRGISAACDNVTSSFVVKQPGRSNDSGLCMGAAEDADDEIWRDAFGEGASLGDMFAHFYEALKDLDCTAWLIAFCIIDKLHLRCEIHNYMKQRQMPVKAVDALGGGGAAIAGLGGFTAPTPFCFYLGNSWRNLFVAYGLALKWHLDLAVSHQYLAALFPRCSSQFQRYFCKTSIAVELEMLRALDFNVFVDPSSVTELLDVFLTPGERECIVRAMNS